MATTGTAMAREIAEIPAVASRQVSLGLTEYRAIGAHLRRRAPAVIVTCARGSSDNASVYLKYLVETRIGIPVAAIGPSVASVYDARLSLDRAVCVTISQSGGSPDLVSLQDHARAGGAETLALLNTPDSPVGSAADRVVPVMAGPETAVAATKSLVASLVAIAGIVAGWTGDDTLVSGLEALPDALAASLACRWDHALPAIAGANSLYVIGRGPGYAIAREAALKLKETCRLHAEAYSAAEVQHGPIAIARSRPRDRFVALMFQARDASRASLEQACAAMRGIGAPVFVADSEERGPSALPVARRRIPCSIRSVRSPASTASWRPSRPSWARTRTGPSTCARSRRRCEWLTPTRRRSSLTRSTRGAWSTWSSRRWACPASPRTRSGSRTGSGRSLRAAAGTRSSSATPSRDGPTSTPRAEPATAARWCWPATSTPCTATTGRRTGRAPTAPTRSPATLSTARSGAAEPRT